MAFKGLVLYPESWETKRRGSNLYNYVISPGGTFVCCSLSPGYVHNVEPRIFPFS